MFTALRCLPALALGALVADPARAQSACTPFDSASIELGATQAPFRRLADLDGDGDVDAVGVRVSPADHSFRLTAYASDGRGSFQPTWHGSHTAVGLTDEGELLLELARLDGDSRLDICVSVPGSRTTWLGQPGPSFASGTETVLALPARALALADLDGDGRADVLWADDAQLRIATSAGASASTAHAAGLPSALRALPGDGPLGRHVLILAGSSAAQIFLATSSTIGASLVLPQELGLVELATGDVDRDGDLDAVLFGVGSPASYRLLRRLAPASWTLEPALAGGPGELLADVDGDLDLDALRCQASGGASYPSNTRACDFQVALNDGTGAFAPAFAFPGVGSPELAGARDVDGDGDVDLVAGRCVYFACGPIRPPSHVAGPTIPNWLGPRDIADRDGDGDLDVGFGLDSVFENDGTGSFMAGAPRVAPPPPMTEYQGPGYPGDFDGDGDVDLLVEIRGPKVLDPASFVRHGMGLLANDGTGSFALARMASERGESFAVDSLETEASLVVDLDFDGDLDLVTRAMDRPAASKLWLNRGSGRFRLVKTVRDTRVEWIEDLDLDGDIDLLMSQPRTTTAELQLFIGSPGTGGIPSFRYDPRFCCWEFHPLAGGIARGDLVQDGYADFAITRAVGNVTHTIALQNLLGQGGSLVANLALDSGFDLAANARVALGDVDQDGICDAFVGARAREDVEQAETHLKRTPSGLFGTFRRFDQVLPRGLLVDLDTDGDLDVLGNRIVFNRTVP